VATASIARAGTLSGTCCYSVDGTACDGWSRHSSELHLPCGTAVGLRRHPVTPRPPVPSQSLWPSWVAWIQCGHKGLNHSCVRAYAQAKLELC